MPVIPTTLIYPPQSLHNSWAVLSFLWPFLFLSFSFLWDIFSILRIKYNEIKWNKIQTFAALLLTYNLPIYGNLKYFIFSFHLLTLDQIRLVVLGHFSSHSLQALSILLSFSALVGSLLSYLTAAAMLYHCQSSHYISTFLSNFSLNLSASLSTHTFPWLLC